MNVSLIKYYKAIPVSELKVDPSLDSQRLFQKSWAAKLNRIWDPELLLVAIVSRRPDGYYLIDGQHSTRVAREREGAGFLRDCMVYEGLTRRQESRLFLAANRDRKAVRPYDTFRVELAAGEPLALQLQAEVHACGLEIAGSPSTNRVAAVQKLKDIAKLRPVLVTRTLQTAEQAWGRHTTSWDNMMIQAIAVDLHLNWERISLDRLVRTLASQPVSLWKANAIQASTGGGGSKSRSTPLARNIGVAYNRRLGPDRTLVLP
ncbi:DUF6551 family protein [Actinoplanes sp. HUAS TT8]|uniref:DUF6551 family protein n=1 Tax=Actinoplanes sp. HUAS TT8 TaxID=3447453 RepID=UPI003F5277B3